LIWKNGDTCEGNITGNKCTGKFVKSNGAETNGTFDWRFDHDDHGHKFG